MAALSKAIVCGCGPSLMPAVPILEQHREILTVGVNDVGRWFTPDHLLVLDQANRFRTKDDTTRVDAIKATKPSVAAWFHRLETKAKEWKECAAEEKRELRHGRGIIYVGNDEFSWDMLDDEGAPLPMAHTSAFGAACLAWRLGAREIGLIGVDISKGHSLDCCRESIDKHFGDLVSQMQRRGGKLWNLSPQSTIQSIPRMALEEFVEWRS